MKNTKRKHLKLCLLLLFMVLGCFAITNVRTTTVQASSRTFKSNGRTYMEKHNDNTLNTVLYQKVSGRYKQVAKSSRYLIYRFSYGKKLYFSSADDETSDIPWVIFEHFLGMWKNSIEFFHIPFFHVQIYQRKESTCISADQRYRAKALENDKRGWTLSGLCAGWLGV